MGAYEGEVIAEKALQAEERVCRPRSARAQCVQETLIQVFWGTEEGVSTN